MNKHYKYTITFDGETFLSNMGYQKRALEIKYERVRAENAEMRLTNHDFWIKVGALGAAAGAILYLILDIIKYHLEHYHCFPCCGGIK